MIARDRMLNEAVALVMKDFEGIVRKGSGAPYVTHLFSVMALVGEYGGDTEQMAAALLHDWIEDVEEGTAEILEARFGPRVARMVVALSDCDGVGPKPAWLARKTTYIAALADEPAEVKLISAADKLHNVTSILRDHRMMGDKVYDNFKAGKSGTIWYYRECFRALGTGWTHPILEELEEAVVLMEVV